MEERVFFCFLLFRKNVQKREMRMEVNFKRYMLWKYLRKLRRGVSVCIRVVYKDGKGCQKDVRYSFFLGFFYVFIIFFKLRCFGCFISFQLVEISDFLTCFREEQKQQVEFACLIGGLDQRVILIYWWAISTVGLSKRMGKFF